MHTARGGEFGFLFCLCINSGKVAMSICDTENCCQTFLPLKYEFG